MGYGTTPRCGKRLCVEVEEKRGFLWKVDCRPGKQGEDRQIHVDKYPRFYGVSPIEFFMSQKNLLCSGKSTRIGASSMAP